MVLSGLKKYPVELSAIVSVADDGGSTGRLRSQLGVLPQGDARECLLALGNCEPWLEELLAYRFEAGDLKGHAVGNLLLAALEKASGSFAEGSQRLGKILQASGQVIPVSEDAMTLQIELSNGKILIGETNLDFSEEIHQFGMKDISLSAPVQACQPALQAIAQADLIVLGPGDVYGSVLPIFLAEGIVEAIKKANAKVLMVCNPTNRKGQTSNFDLAAYVELFEKRLGSGRINYVIYNNAPIPEFLVKELEAKEGEGCVVGFDQAKKLAEGLQIIQAPILREEKIVFSKDDAIAATRAFIQFDGDKLAKVVMEILEK